MDLETLFIAFFVVSGCSLAGLAAYLRSSPRGIRGIRSFVALLGLMSLWSFGAAVKLLAPPTVERALVALELPLGVMFALTILVFASQYTGRTWHRDRLFVVGVVVALTGLAVGIVTNPLHNLFWSGIELSTIVFPHFVHTGLGPLYLLYVAFAYGVYALAVYALLDIHLRSRYNTASVILVAIGGSLPLLINVVSILDRAPVPGLDYTPIGLAAFGAAATWSIRMDFFDIVPVARDTAVEQSNQGMIILDSRHRVRDFNPAAVRLLPGLSDHRGDPLGAVVDDAGAWLDPTDRKRLEPAPEDGRDSYLSVQTSPITDEPHHLGWTIIVSDVSAAERRHRHLQLVSRVLRHNMANRINTIAGHAELLEDHVDPAGREHLQAIETSADSIMDTSAKLRTIQRITTADTAHTPTDVAATAEAVVGRYAKRYPAATVTADCPAEAYARCPYGLEAALENLVENGIEHNPSEAPTVTVRVETGADTVTVSVTDDGPGIPDSERRILENGETPLEHSPGIGLWLVYCFVEQAGQALTFERTADGGSEVRFPLERTDRPSDPDRH
jgi:signal transduction histidine kinase